MTQLIIDTGAAPNDGTGDPLRTAFTKVNYDFTAVYDAGPVGSNIQITDNRIITINTNGNLVLAPNGIGNVVSNVNILPNMSNIRSLGSSAYRWDSTYTRYLDAGSANITSVNIGNANIGNISTITIDVANIHILGGTNGYVLQTDGTGNLTWTAQTGGSGNATPGGANTQIQYNDAGVFGGTAGFTFDSTSNTLSAVKINTTDVFNSNGIILENSSLTQGATAAVVIPANGSSDPIQVNNTYGNIVLQSGVNADITGSWTFGNDGTTTLPSGAGFGQGDSGQLKTSGDTLSLDLRDQNGRGFYTNSDGYTLRSNGTYNWLFNTTGKLTTPGSIQIGSGTTGIVNWDANSIGLTSDFDNDLTGIYLVKNGDAQMYANGTVQIYSDTGNTGQQWTFGTDGNLTLPSNTASINYANGQPYGGSGGGANTGNVTFNNVTIQGVDSYAGLSLSASPTDTANLKYLQVRAGDNDSHIHFDTGNNDAYDQYFGNDAKYLKLEAGTFGNVIIGTENPGEYYNWTFGNDGNTIVPRDIQSITTGFPFTSNISGITTGEATVVVTIVDGPFFAPLTGQVTITGVVGTTEANATWYYQAVENNEFQLYNDAALTSPVDGTTWTTYESGGLAVSAGYSNLAITGGNVSIVTNTGNTWTFGADGSFTPPTQPSNQRTGTGLTLKIGDTNTQTIITGPAPIANVFDTAPRLVVAGQDGLNSGEGGDIYLWAGRSGPNGGSGGDIKVDGGDGYNGSEGGTVKIRGGYSYDSGNGQGYGGFVEIYAGGGGYGAPVDIRSGQGNSQANCGNITLTVPTVGTWTFGNDGELTLPTGGHLGFAGKGWTGLDGGNGSPVSLTSFYANGFYAGCVTNNNDGNIIISTYTGDGLQGNWTFDNGANLVLAPTNGGAGGAGSGEAAKLRGTRKIVNGYTNSYAYSTVLNTGGTPTVAYTATDNSVMSVKVTFAVEGANGVWEQFDVSAVIDSTGNDVNFTVSNRVKRDNAIPDTVVTAAVDGSDRITISLNLDASQSTGWSSFDAVEFGLMAG